MPRNKNWKKKMASLVDDDIVSYVRERGVVSRWSLRGFTSSEREAAGVITRLQKLGVLTARHRWWPDADPAPQCKANTYSARRPK